MTKLTDERIDEIANGNLPGDPLDHPPKWVRSLARAIEAEVSQGADDEIPEFGDEFFANARRVRDIPQLAHLAAPREVSQGAAAPACDCGVECEDKGYGVCRYAAPPAPIAPREDAWLEECEDLIASLSMASYVHGLANREEKKRRGAQRQAAGEALKAHLIARPAAPLPAHTQQIVTALRTQQQADEDGVMVTVSRQACDEAAAILESGVAAPPSDGPVAAPPPGELPDEREAFEAWALTSNLAYRDPQIGICFYSVSDGNPSWRAWQARAALAAEQKQ